MTATDPIRLYARDVGCDPPIGGKDNVQDALGAGGLLIATFNWSFQCPGSYVVPEVFGVTQPLDPVADTGTGSAQIAVPLNTYGIGAVVQSIGGNVAGIPDSTDSFDIEVTLQVANAAGTEYLIVQGITNLAAHTPSGTFDVANLSVGSSVGADLTLAAGGHSIMSAAGGVYGVIGSLQLSYH